MTLVHASQLSRLAYAKRRLIKIRDTEPRFTAAQIEELVAVLRGEVEAS